jgi:hypothetical protein
MPSCQRQHGEKIMNSRIVWVPVVIGIWSALSGCSKRPEPANEKHAQRERVSNTAGEEAGPLAVDSTRMGSMAAEETSKTAVEVRGGTPVLSYVSTFVGSTPVETSLWQSNPLASYLYQTLGPRHETLLINMQETGPIQEENGVVYVLGKKKYSEDRAAVAIDTATDGIYVWLLVAGKPEEYQWGDEPITLPAAIRKLVDAAGPTP